MALTAIDCSERLRSPASGRWVAITETGWMMDRALLVVDVQNDFTEDGALAVAGGDAVAVAITAYLAGHAGDYRMIVGSRDWHDADGDNGGHFSPTPDYLDSWPIHCIADTQGAAYDPLLETDSFTDHVFKGRGEPAYSMFEGATEDGESIADLLATAGIGGVNVVGIATDHCVRATALDALAAGVEVRVLTDLIAGVAPKPSATALQELSAAGAVLATSDAAAA